MPKLVKKDLAQIIRDNPGCFAIVDNDSWTLYLCDPTLVDDAESVELATSDDTFEGLPQDGYGAGSCYGGDLLQALAQIVGIKVESV